MIARLAWVSAAAARGRDEDEPLGLAALASAGVHADVLDWDDAGVDWAGYERVVLRSTWDYPGRLVEFLSWLDRVERVSELCNPGALVRWNLDKRYLLELADMGVPVVPTTVVEPGAAVPPVDAGVVVKPAIGAGGRDVAGYPAGRGGDARVHIGRLHERGETVLLQPVLDTVSTEGEWPMVFFAGRFSHSANKRVTPAESGRVDELYLTETNTRHTADARQVAVAEAAVAAVADRFGVPAYARVDLVLDGTGDYRVLELELVEPSLFLPQDDRAADRLAAVLARPAATG